MAGNAGGPRWAKPHNCQFNCALFIYYMTQSIRFRFLEQDMVSDVVLVCTSLLPHSIYMPLGYSKAKAESWQSTAAGLG